MGFNFISRHFPPPKFLKPSHIGISFSDSNIKVMMFNGHLPKPELKSLIIPLEKGTIVDGSIVNAEEVTKKLSSIRSQFSVPFVFFTIPDELTYIFSVTIPIGKGGDATESVAFTIEENVPLSLADTVFDFVPTQIVRNESEYMASMVVVACVRKDVEKFSQAINNSGFEVVGCIHESQAIVNSVIPQKSTGLSCVVHSRESRIGIYLVKGSTVQFSTIRSISEGDYGRQFLDEYEKFLEYSTKYGIKNDGAIETVLVCGDFEYAKKTVEAIVDSNISIKNAKLANVWSNVLSIEKDAPSITYEDSLSLAGPIGAVLSDII